MSVVCILASAPASADSLNLPIAPGGPGGEDAIETMGGTRCRQSINASGPYLDVGFGVTRDQDYNGYDHSGGDGMLGYARLIVPLTGSVPRIDCRRLFELEIERLEMEIELMRMGMR